MVNRWRCGVAMLVAAQCLAAGDPVWVQEPTADSGPRFQSILEAERTARLLALLLDSGRTVISERAPLFEAPAQATAARAGAAEADEFEAQLTDLFRSRSGLDLHDLSAARVPSQAKELLKQLVAVSKQAVAEAQPAGAGATGREFIPAVFGARVAARFAEATGVRLKQTSLAPRNPANAPDHFERTALQEFADPTYPREQVISEVTVESRSLRLMFPLYITRRCLDCHGEPKGQPDRMGYPREGLRLGQNAGAISVLIPLEP